VISYSGGRSKSLTHIYFILLRHVLLLISTAPQNFKNYSKSTIMSNRHGFYCGFTAHSKIYLSSPKFIIFHVANFKIFITFKVREFSIFLHYFHLLHNLSLINLMFNQSLINNQHKLISHYFLSIFDFINLLIIMTHNLNNLISILLFFL
jgi:hypothetical protein